MPVDEECWRRRWRAASVARAAVRAWLHCRAGAWPRPTARRRSTRASSLALQEGLALLLRLLLERSALQPCAPGGEWCIAQTVIDAQFYPFDAMPAPMRARNLSLPPSMYVGGKPFFGAFSERYS